MTRTLWHHWINTYRRLDSKQVSDLDHREIQYLTPASSVPGESPPPPPRVFFGREELIEKVVGLAERLTPIALIGVGGIGKTSIALTAIHNDRIKQRFGDNRWFIRCDKFPTSLTHFLCRLSKAVGTGIENPEDMTSLRPFLSSKEMFIILDNAESILDPQGANAQEIYEVVEELSRLDNICLCITSRIFTIPPNCETLDVPALSMGAAHDTFYRLYKRDEQSHSVDDILKQLDFHPLSVTLLAIVAHHSGWSTDRLTKEWGRQRTGLLQTEHNRSLAVTIELSLASPTFQELGPDARALLGVVAFFPQGINENNLSWLFPTIPNRVNIFDKFCTLSLTYRRDGSITMLAPLRDYFCPKDPMSSPLLLTTKDCYFHQLSADVDPDRPSSRELRWITSEDVNIEHLLDVFTTIDMSSRSVWSACASFMYHLYWHKPRLVVLESRVNGLPDNHPSKPRCLYHLSQLFGSVGNQVGRKQLLTHSLKLWRGWGDERWVARTLKLLSGANRRMGLYKEGILLAEEALDICERHGDTAGQAQCLGTLARLLYDDNQHDAAEEAISRAIDLLPEEGEKFEVCKCRRVLGNICRSKGKREKAISHFKVALGIASSCNWHDQLFWIHHSLAELFSKEGRFGIAYAHIERTKFHALNNAYYLGRAMKLQARILYTQRKLGEAKSEVLRAVEVFEKLKAVRDLESCRRLLRKIQTERSGRLR